MYPFKVTLVGCRDGVASQVRTELANAAVQVDGEWPNVDGLLQASPYSPAERRLFIVQLNSEQDLQDLKRLHGTFRGQPILSLVGATDAVLLTSANRAGATQVVSVPVRPDDFAEALHCIASQFSQAPTTSQVIAVSGVTGGCGATTVAVNLAHEIAHLHELHCVLVELAAGRGMLATYLNVEPRFNTQDVLSAGERVDAHLVQQALTRIANNFEILAAPHRSITPGSASSKDVIRMIESARTLANVIVLDMSCTYDTLYFETIATAEQVVLVAEQRVPSIRSLMLLSDTLRRQDAAHAQHLVVNRYNPKLVGFQTGDLEKLLQVPKVMTIAEDTHSVTEAVNRGRPLRQESSHSKALADIDTLARVLMNREGRAAQVQPKGLFGQLGRALGLSG